MKWWESEDRKYWQQNHYRWIRDSSVGKIVISKSDGVRQRNFFSPSLSFSPLLLCLSSRHSQFPANNPSYPLCSTFYTTLPVYSTPLHSTPFHSHYTLHLIPTSFNALHFPSLYPILFTSLHFLYLLWGRVLRQVWQCRCYTCSSP